jgi:hypothetical protein
MHRVTIHLVAGSICSSGTWPRGRAGKIDGRKQQQLNGHDLLKIGMQLNLCVAQGTSSTMVAVSALLRELHCFLAGFDAAAVAET